MWPKSENQIVTKVEKKNIRNMAKLKNWNCEKYQKLKLWQNLHTWVVTKLKNSNSKTTQRLKFWQISKTYKCDKTQISTKLKT